jgi:hypothetical protein
MALQPTDINVRKNEAEAACESCESSGSIPLGEGRLNHSSGIFEESPDE